MQVKIITVFSVVTVLELLYCGAKNQLNDRWPSSP